MTILTKNTVILWIAMKRLSEFVKFSLFPYKR